MYEIFYISVTVTSTVPWLLLNFSFHALGLGCRLDIGDLNIVCIDLCQFSNCIFLSNFSQFPTHSLKLVVIVSKIPSYLWLKKKKEKQHDDENRLTI